jgi:hypothetical protein
MQADKFQFTAAAAAAAAAIAAAAATSSANTEKFIADYLISNHCQNNKNHLITKMTVLIDNFPVAAAAASAARAAKITVNYLHTSISNIIVKK